MSGVKVPRHTAWLEAGGLKLPLAAPVEATATPEYVTTRLLREPIIGASVIDQGGHKHEWIVDPDDELRAALTGASLVEVQRECAGSCGAGCGETWTVRAWVCDACGVEIEAPHRETPNARVHVSTTVDYRLEVVGVSGDLETSTVVVERGDEVERMDLPPMGVVEVRHEHDFAGERSITRLEGRRYLHPKRAPDKP